MKRPILLITTTLILGAGITHFLWKGTPEPSGAGNYAETKAQSAVPAKGRVAPEAGQLQGNISLGTQELPPAKAKEYRTWLQKFQLENRERQLEELLGRDKALRPMVQTLAAFPIRYEGSEASNAWFEMTEELRVRGPETARAIERILDVLPAGFADERQFLIGFVTRLENIDSDTKLEIYAKFLERGATNSALQGDVGQFGIEASLAVLSGTELGKDSKKLPQIVRTALRGAHDPRVRPLLLGPLFRSHPKEALALAQEFGLNEFSNRLRTPASAAQ